VSAGKGRSTGEENRTGFAKARRKFGTEKTYSWTKESTGSLREGKGKD